MDVGTISWLDAMVYSFSVDDERLSPMIKRNWELGPDLTLDTTYYGEFFLCYQL